ncbi:MAG: class I SAM-dependent methyltransferase [Acidimicrobiia bacterium]
MPWVDLGEWWLEEIIDDPAYESVVTPLLIEILHPAPGLLYLDLGCGEGRVMRAVAATSARVIGLDLNERLARLAPPSLVARLPTIPFATDALDGAFAVLVLEHVEDHQGLFGETARVTRVGGTFTVVMNHPVWTATGSTPIGDSDGEMLWRPGDYFTAGSTEVESRGQTVTFHHRSMSDLLNAAADAGWSLEQMVERPHHDTGALPAVPRLLACQWRLMS